MTFLTIDASNINVLGVIKVYKVREVVDTHPFDRLRLASITLILFVPANCFVEFFDFVCVKFFSVTFF